MIMIILIWIPDDKSGTLARWPAVGQSLRGRPTVNALDDQTAAPAEPLAWAVKMSFRRYVQGAGGTITVYPPAAEEGLFYLFPRSTAPSPEGEARYEGEVAFYAHFGALDVLLADPAIVFADGRVTITVLDAMHLPDRSHRMTIAWLSEMEDAVPSAGRREFWPHLTEEGAQLFGGVYPTNALLDPISFVPEWR
jgi:hypothetical protein